MLKEISGDDQALNLAGPIEDAKRPRVPEQAFDRRAAYDAEAAKNLHGLINDVEGGLCREKFGDRGFARDAPLRGIVLPGSAINQQGGGVYAHGHVGELGLDHLVF